MMTAPAQLAFDDAVALAGDLAAGRTSAVALTRAALERIAETNADWRIFITIAPETALAEAEASDARRAEGRTLGPLDGIPIAIKDNIDVAGMPTTVGTAAYRNRHPARDAAVIARLRDAGAVILGKLNLHEGALGATTDNPTYGRCENPRVPGSTPGGSSGGSGAAVAGALVAIALGTDTMGSVRIPAAYCGNWGLKPTKGLVGTSGLAYLSWTLDTIGPLANSPEDLALAIRAMAGPDSDDPRSVATPEGWDPTPTKTSLKGLVLGRPSVVDSVACEPEVRAAYDALLARAVAEGAIIKDVAIDGWDTGKARRAGLLISEAEAGSLLGADLDTLGDGFSDGFRRFLDYGRKAPGERIAAAYAALDRLGLAARQALDGVDALILPTAPQRAFAHGAPAPADQADFTALANIAGLPAIAFPLPGDPKPNSAQLVGRAFEEGKLLGIAKALFGLAP
ncbi:amidase [Kaistia terrae]|uniref:Amidase n=1 Tax=Kaistia terrae TaxID=537017 RepID=A0ABW0PQ19_9HYPH|nr:amidase [Kaistia terrae]MCX5577682.1 amidase [Kaistia terrae]